jgi:hypothetical protein
MDDEQFDALKRAADDGVQFDGLYAHYGREDYDRDPDAYTFGTPAGEHTGLSESEFREAAADAPWYVSNWYYWEHVVEGHDTPRRAFLRWLEGADEHDVGYGTVEDLLDVVDSEVGIESVATGTGVQEDVESDGAGSQERASDEDGDTGELRDCSQSRGATGIGPSTRVSDSIAGGTRRCPTSWQGKAFETEWPRH